MRYLMFTGNDDRPEVHRYSDDEVTEVFGKAAPAFDAMGFLNTRRGIWSIWSTRPRSAIGKTSQAEPAQRKTEPALGDQPRGLFLCLPFATPDFIEHALVVLAVD